MSQTTTPSGAELLATIDSNARALRYDGDVYTSDQLYEIHTAVSALIARNAELEAERKARMSADDVLSAIEDSAICLENWGELHEARDLRRAAYTLIAERDALAAENKALREALTAYRDAIHFAQDKRALKAAIKDADEKAAAALARTPANGAGND